MFDGHLGLARFELCLQVDRSLFLLVRTIEIIGCKRPVVLEFPAVIVTDTSRMALGIVATALTSFIGSLCQHKANQKCSVLKSNDAKTISQIDAVFVTVEPEGGSTKPSGKPLLFTYLRLDPNHP